METRAGVLIWSIIYSMCVCVFVICDVYFFSLRYYSISCYMLSLPPMYTVYNVCFSVLAISLYCFQKPCWPQAYLIPLME